MRKHSIGFIPDFQSICSEGKKIASSSDSLREGDVIEVIVDWKLLTFSVRKNERVIADVKVSFLSKDFDLYFGISLGRPS